MERRQPDNGGAQKKVKPTTRESTGALFMLRCAELGLSDEALNHMTPGMVYDLLIERANDREKYPAKATQEDIYKFFGGFDG